LESVAVRPKKTGISVQTVALVWAPYWKEERGKSLQAW
jgi:hypothetical protein